MDELRVKTSWTSGYLKAVLDQETIINVNILLGGSVMQRTFVQSNKEDNLQIITWF